MKILVLSGYVGPEEGYLNQVKDNHIRYTNLHNYGYLFVDNYDFNDEFVDESQAATYSWLKASKSLEIMRSGRWDYIFAIDPDSIFWKVNRNLDDLIGIDKNFIFSGDSWDLFNGGHFLVKCTEWSITFFEKWLSMRKLSMPDLNSTHIGTSGRLMDQPAMNILLKSGKEDGVNAISSFNSINGYMGNKDRHHKFFHFTHAPTHRLRLLNSKRLIHQNFRENVEVVVQDRLNGYPFKLPGKNVRIDKYDVLHFPGDSKHLISEYLEKLQY